MIGHLFIQPERMAPSKHVFPQFGSASCIYSEFWLARSMLSVVGDGEKGRAFLLAAIYWEPETR